MSQTTTCAVTRAPAGTKPPVFTPPQYTIRDVHNAIPRHCFDRSTFRTLSYVLRDFAFVLALASAAVTQIPKLQDGNMRLLAWAAYSLLQSFVFTGIWEIAHEAGHQALSPKKWVNYSLGLVLHSFLLVPFHSWRITHATHHKTTNNIEKDIAFVPDIKDEWLAKRAARGWFMKSMELLEDVPICVLAEVIGHQLIAWPTYLLINNFALPRMAVFPWWKRSHFYFGGDGPNFKPLHRQDVITSGLGVATVAGLLWAAVSYFGAWNVMKVYGFPYLWTNNWILVVTFLQHTDTTIPYYANDTWTFTRGAASAVDRDFGIIGRHLLHGAIENHVVHHHAPRIPFYHATEATQAIKGVMGTHYVRDYETPYLWAFWKNRRACRFVEEVDKGSEIYFFPKTE